MFVLVGGEAEHEGLVVLEGADKGKVAEYEVGPGAGKAPIHEPCGQGKGEKADHGFDGGDEIGAVTHRIDPAISDGGKGLGAEEISFLEPGPGAGANDTLELVHADERIDERKDKVNDEI